MKKILFLLVFMEIAFAAKSQIIDPYFEPCEEGTSVEQWIKMLAPHEDSISGLCVWTCMFPTNEIPPKIFELENLKNLEVDCENEAYGSTFIKRINHIPKEIVQLQNLRTLEFNISGIDTLPEYLTQLKDLANIKIEWDYRLKNIDVVCAIENLKYLNLTQCSNIVFPECIDNLKKLTYLELTLNHKYHDLIYSKLIGMESLTHLDITSSKDISIKALKMFAQSKHFKDLTLPINFAKFIKLRKMLSKDCYLSPFGIDIKRLTENDFYFTNEKHEKKYNDAMKYHLVAELDSAWTKKKMSKYHKTIYIVPPYIHHEVLLYARSTNYNAFEAYNKNNVIILDINPKKILKKYNEYVYAQLELFALNNKNYKPGQAKNYVKNVLLPELREKLTKSPEVFY